MGFLETCATLLALVTLGGIVGYFSSGGQSSPDVDPSDDPASIANAQYTKPRHLTGFGITDED
jgi:hypothetical protein